MRLASHGALLAVLLGVNQSSNTISVHDFSSKRSLFAGALGEESLNPRNKDIKSPNKERLVYFARDVADLQGIDSGQPSWKQTSYSLTPGLLQYGSDEASQGAVVSSLPQETKSSAPSRLSPRSPVRVKYTSKKEADQAPSWKKASGRTERRRQKHPNPQRQSHPKEMPKHQEVASHTKSRPRYRDPTRPYGRPRKCPPIKKHAARPPGRPTTYPPIDDYAPRPLGRPRKRPFGPKQRPPTREQRAEWSHKGGLMTAKRHSKQPMAYLTPFFSERAPLPTGVGPHFQEEPPPPLPKRDLMSQIFYPRSPSREKARQKKRRSGHLSEDRGSSTLEQGRKQRIHFRLQKQHQQQQQPQGSLSPTKSPHESTSGSEQLRSIPLGSLHIIPPRYDHTRKVVRTLEATGHASHSERAHHTARARLFRMIPQERTAALDQKAPLERSEQPKHAARTRILGYQKKQKGFAPNSCSIRDRGGGGIPRT